MNGWQPLPAARRVTHCPVALALRDEFSGGGPLSDPELVLERQAGSSWEASGIPPVRTASGIHAWLGLGRSVNPVAAPFATIRVRVTLAHQIPLYRATEDGLAFQVAAYNDGQPPASTPLMPETVLLLPGPSYPFRPGLRVLRGRVLDGAGAPVSDALVVGDNVERAMSDASGGFSLPLRWQPASGNVAIDVSHPRSGMAASVTATLPAALDRSFDVTVS